MIMNYINDIKMLTNEFDDLDIFSRQALLIKLYQTQLFVDNNSISNEEHSLVRDALQDFLTKFKIQRELTIGDFNFVFGPSTEKLDLNDEKLYNILYNMFAEEWRSPDMTISFKIKELISSIVDRIMQETECLESDCACGCNSEPNNISNKELINNRCDSRDIFAKNCSPEGNHCEDRNIFSREEVASRPSEFYPTFNDFVIKNKDYLKEYVVRNNLIEYKCNCCGLTSWQNNPLMLYLHSKSGVYSNKNLNDLEFLCPNCYSQIGD